MNPIFLSDFYKTDHRRQYPKGTQMVYSNMTARSSRIPDINHVVFFGLQYFIYEYLQKAFNQHFFGASRDQVVAEYKQELDTSLGPDSVPMDHILDLHKLGYLPITIKALPEGTMVPIKVPFLTIYNTEPRFFWVTNFLETMLSNALWHPITTATIAFQYRKLLQDFANKTSDVPEFVKWQGHDFSMRGHSSLESSAVSGMGHLLSFMGTDTIPAIRNLRTYYYADGLVGGSVPATEHSVMCFGGKETEFETYRRLITEVYPKGIVSIVSDTWDYWKVLTEVIPSLKKEILARDGKVVIRPDSGDPEKIICGDPSMPTGSPAWKGTAQLLWETFGGKVNTKGYRELDPHIGMIYGDSITLERAESISRNLYIQSFASTNIVYGIGSFTYQYLTRDTFGIAMKATAGIIDGQEIHAFKDPVTDNGTKKSAKGFLRVNSKNGILSMEDQLTFNETRDDEMNIVFENGFANWTNTLTGIRSRIDWYLDK